MQQASATVRLYGVSYELDLEACRAAMAPRVADLRSLKTDASGMALVAEAAGVSRRTLERFLSGEKVSVESLADIITRGLKLNVPDVLRRVEEQEAAS